MDPAHASIRALLASVGLTAGLAGRSSEGVTGLGCFASADGDDVSLLDGPILDGTSLDAIPLDASDANYEASAYADASGDAGDRE